MRENFMRPTQEAKHTPGPWTVSQQQGLRLFIVGNDEAIAEVLHTNFNKEMFANADLIAKSPDLFNELESLRAQIGLERIKAHELSALRESHKQLQEALREARYFVASSPAGSFILITKIDGALE